MKFIPSKQDFRFGSHEFKARNQIYAQGQESRLHTRSERKNKLAFQETRIWRSRIKIQEDKNENQEPRSSDDGESIESFKTQATSIRISESNASAGAHLGARSSTTKFMLQVQDQCRRKSSRSMDKVFKIKVQVSDYLKTQTSTVRISRSEINALVLYRIVGLAVLQVCCKFAAARSQESSSSSSSTSKRKKSRLRELSISR